jgi:hypothetical protein
MDANELRARQVPLKNKGEAGLHGLTAGGNEIRTSGSPSRAMAFGHAMLLS